MHIKNIVVILFAICFCGKIQSATIYSGGGADVSVEYSTTTANSLNNAVADEFVLFRIKDGPDASFDGYNSGDSEIESCVKITAFNATATGGLSIVQVSSPSGFGYVYAGRLDFAANGITVNTPLNFSASFNSSCKKAYDAYLWTAVFLGGALKYASVSNEPIHIPAATSCSANVGDVDFGKLDAGSSKSSTLVITKSGDEGGVVTITGNDMQSDGTLNLNGNEGISVKPDSTDYIKGNAWYADTARGSIPLTLSSKKGVSGGDYSSTLTATLTCD